MPKGSLVAHITKYKLGHFMRQPGQKKDELIRILCLSEEFEVGALAFYQKDQVPESTISSNGKLFYLTFEIDRYPGIIEMFRYEKPISVYVKWDENNVINFGVVSTDMPEPIGEQEGV